MKTIIRIIAVGLLSFFLALGTQAQNRTKNKITIPVGSAEKFPVFKQQNNMVQENVLSATPSHFPLPSAIKDKKSSGNRPDVKPAKSGERPIETLMYAAWSRYDVYEDFYDLFGFDIDEPTYPYFLTTNDDLINANHQVCAAAWDGKQVQFISELYIPSYDRYLIGYRGTLDPLTGEMHLFSHTGYASAETGNISSLTYDRSSGKLYGVNLNAVLYEVSMTDSTSQTIDTIRWGESSIGYPLTLSASPGGTLYVISSNGSLFRINKQTAAAERVGDLGVNVATAYQSATFDSYTGELIWARVGSTEEDLNLYKVDTLTGRAEMYSQFGIQALGLQHVLYDEPCDIPPAVIDSLSRTAENGTIRFRWINPSTNLLGHPLTCLGKVRVYRAVGTGDWVLLDSVENVQAGKESFYTRTETQEGYYRYAFKAVNTNGKACTYYRTTDYGYYTYSLPYSTGFEENHDNKPLIFDGSSFVTEPSLVYEGERAVHFKTYSRLDIVGLPLEKGATYKLTFYSRGYEEGMDFKSGNAEVKNRKNASKETYTPWSKKPFATLNVRVGGKSYYPENSRSLTWAKSEVEFYAPENIKTTLEFGTSIFDVYYLDNVTIEASTPNTTPNVPYNVSLSSEIGPGHEVELSWTNPKTTAGDAALEQLSGVIVELTPFTKYSIDSEYDTVIVDTVYTNQIGGRISKKYTMPFDGYWYCQLNAFNNIGNSPYDTVIRTPWLGRDTILNMPRDLEAERLPDGRIKLTWEKMPEVGFHGGWLDGTITGYQIIRINGNNVSSTTTEVTTNEYTTEVLPMNIYAFGLSAIRNGLYHSDTVSLRLIGGLRDGQEPVGELESEAGYSLSPFHATSASSGMSHISQILYGKQLFDEPCIIDTLYFFMNRPSLQFSQNYRIHLGYYRKSAFTEYNDWLPIDSMQEVYKGRVSFDRQAEILKIPVKPFWYDGHDNLLLSVIRGKQTCSREVQFINNVSDIAYPHIYDYHTEEQTDFYELHGRPSWASGVYAVPLMVVNKMRNLNTVMGRVANASGDPVVGARVAITKKAESDGIDFVQVLFTDTGGKFSFAYFPDNTYEIHISKTGYGNFERELNLSGGMTEDLDVTLVSAVKVSVSGRLTDAQEHSVAGAVCRLTDLEGEVHEAVSDADGNYEFSQVYGMTRYTFTVSHDHYMPYRTEVKIEDKETTVLPDVTLLFYPFPPRNLSAMMASDGSAVDLHWDKPLQLSAKTVKAYHGAHLNNVCSSGDQTVAIRFDPEKLRQMVDERGSDELLGVNFFAADTTAHFFIHIYQGDEDEPAYTQEVGYLPNGVFHEAFLNEPFHVDTTKDLFVGVFVPSGYKGCPFGKDAGPQINNGSYIRKTDGWRLMSDYMLPGSTSANWILDAVFGTSEPVDAPGGYRVYRAEDMSTPIQWGEALAETESGTTVWRDETLSSIPFGDFRYGVQADWMQEVYSENRISNRISKNMFFDVQVRLMPENPVLVGAEIKLTAASDSTVYYSAEADKQQCARLDSVHRGAYTLTVTGNGFNPYSRPVNIASDTSFDIQLSGVGNEAMDMASMGISVYPNPSSDGRFTLSTERGNARYEVFSVEGKLLLSGKLSSKTVAIDLSAYGSGVYVLKAVSAEGIFTRKLIVGR